MNSSDQSDIRSTTNDWVKLPMGNCEIKKKGPLRMETAWGHSLSVAAETNVLTEKNISLNPYYVNRN